LGCEKYPRLDLGRVKTKSNLYFTWQCRCGSRPRRKVTDVVKIGDVVCDGCRPAGKSRLEFEVAELLRQMQTTDVLTHYGATRKDEVDLYFPAFSLAVELDPELSHARRSESDRERLLTHRKTYERVVRIREEGIPEIDGCPVVPAHSDAYGWAQAVVEFIAREVRPAEAWRALTEVEQLAAMRRGGQEWLALLRTPPTPSLADRPELVAEFLQDLKIPGRAPRWISLGAGAPCLWRCGVCEHEYKQRVDHRTGPARVGCPQCSRARGAAATRKPAKGQSAAERAPGLVEEFVLNKTNPASDLSMMRPRSRDV
jgi:hypothetical protein